MGNNLHGNGNGLYSHGNKFPSADAVLGLYSAKKTIDRPVVLWSNSSTIKCIFCTL